MNDGALREKTITCSVSPGALQVTSDVMGPCRKELWIPGNARK